MLLDTRALCRFARFLAAAFVLTWACQVLASPKGDIAADRVSQANYRHILDDLLYTHYGDDRGFGAQHNLALINIIAEMEGYGLTVDLEPVVYEGNVYTNVVGTMQGSLFPDQEYIVGAHYDSLHNPGADDNASGTALVLEAARVLTAYQSDLTIRFIAFDREEQGFYGSWAYVNDHDTSGIRGMISTDMVAWNRGTDKVEIHASPVFDAFKMDVAQAVITYGDGLSYELHLQSNASDQHPFQYRGVPACLLIEDWGNPYYHKWSDSVDTPNYIDYAFATKITRVVVGFLVDHAGVQVPLDCNDNGLNDLDDIASGYSLDCDRNSTPDECDPDCDESGIPDVCELAGTFTSSSTELSPFYHLSPQTYVINEPRPAGGDVTLSFAASANLWLSDEYVRVTLNNNPLEGGDLFVDNAFNCSDPPDTDEIVLTAERFNGIVGDGAAVIKMFPSQGATGQGCGLSSYITVAVTYESLGSPDCNANLVPDFCELAGDIDGDGYLTLTDYANAVACLSGPCSEPQCEPPIYNGNCCELTDFDLDGDYDLEDFSAFTLGLANP